MLKISLFMLVIISIASTSAFAESTLELQVSSEEINALDSVWISGKITDVSEFKPVKLRIIGPDGALVFAPQLAIGDNGEFKKLLNPPVPSFKAGTYLITASHEDTEVSASTQFTVIAQAIPRNEVPEIIQKNPIEEKTPISSSGITLIADAVNGSDVITITGNTSFRDSDITLIVSSPIGNLITIAQVTPGIYGDIEIEIKTGGPMWKEDGLYTITANQGVASEHKESIQVEIKDGVVVPEFGVIASLVLAISIISIIIVSSKSKLALPTRF